MDSGKLAAREALYECHRDDRATGATDMPVHSEPESLPTSI